MDLRKFPMDIQFCPLIIESCKSLCFLSELQVTVLLSKYKSSICLQLRTNGFLCLRYNQVTITYAKREIYPVYYVCPYSVTTDQEIAW